ncbi:hypothetical protein EB118_11995 [bacterium]|jgi:hypothetical protein|nr:hypothetical protein [bacterium]NBX97747.1 hypothetical protein [bacterium]NDC94953.1 hypothetical protein [bacterium]NDD84688.1 hypothetical protein [bacterium]NDG30782.1 hypothetical protein [bacterium]
MSEILTSIGIERPKAKVRFTFKEVCITIAWSALVLMVGLSIATAVQTGNAYVVDTNSLGL